MNKAKYIFRRIYDREETLNISWAINNILEKKKNFFLDISGNFSRD